MSVCGRKALTLLSSVFAVCSLGLLGIAVSTDYWLYLEEGIIMPLNQSTEIRMSLHSGLWRVCFLAGKEKGRCFTIEYVMPMNVQMTSESTVSVLTGAVQFFQSEERAADDLLGRVNDPLQCFPLSHCTAGVPHTYTRDYGGGLQTWWDSGLGQGLVEYHGEDSSQLVHVVLQHMSWYAIGSHRLPRVDGPQHASDLMLLRCEGEAAVDHGLYCSYLRWLHIKAGKEEVQLLRQCGITNSSSEVSPVVQMIRSATPFPLVSLFFMFIGFVLSNIGHIRPHRTIFAFVSGIFFILSGLSLVVGLVLYISNINDEMLNRTKTNEAYFSYKYGWSFAFAAISFLLTEAAGVMSVYLFMKRYTAEELYRPHSNFYGPRLSNCSDYSAQFLHPDAWTRG
ncbi:hypothetical protein QTP70_024244, partial [Hemibagrus guttatus]